MLEKVIETYLGDFFIDPTNGSAADRQRLLKEWLAAYLSAGHRSDAASGCVMPSLSADVARSNDAVRAVYKRKMIALIAKLANELTGEELRPRKTRLEHCRLDGGRGGDFASDAGWQ